MSTPSTIARKNEDGTLTAINCNYDGYPSSVGTLLEERYSDPAKVDALIKMGDIWSLGNEPVDVITPIMAALGCRYPYELVARQGKLDEKTVDELLDMYTRRISDKYAREARTYDDVDALLRNEDGAYVYVFDGGKWRVYDGWHGRRLVTIATAVRRDRKEMAAAA